VEVEKGRVLAAQRITGEPKEKIFSIVDKLTLKVKKDLFLPAQAEKEETPKVADVTTHSQEAYRYYLEGMDNYNKYYFTEAEKSFEKALEYDSTFAMAYYRLASSKRGEELKRLTAKAVKYSNKASQKEKYQIKSWAAYVSLNYSESIKELQKIVERYPDEKEAFYILGAYMYADKLHEFKEAIYYLNKAIQIDPLYKVAYNALAYAYNEIGDFDKSIWAINKYIELAPDEPNPYDSRADLYAWNGKLDQAIESYKKALEIKPDFYMSRFKLGDMYLFKRDYAHAESCFEALSSSNEKVYRSGGRLCLALIPLYQGKLEEALRTLDDGIAADRMEQVEEEANAYKHLIKASIYEDKKKWSLALKEAEIGIEILKKVTPNDPDNGKDYYASLLAKSGKISEAEELTRAFKKDIEQKNPTLMYIYWWTLGDIEQAKGNIKTAIDYFEKAEKDAPTPSFYRRTHLAEIYLKIGRLDEAVAELEKALSRYEENRVGTIAVKAYYLLGLAYEKSGWNKKAIEKYEEFLDIWKNADPGIKEVEDAKERLKKLKK
jgi:tetratricopeptide (TPR) repeat protein